MAKTILRLIDADTGESCLEAYAVPEGWCLDLGQADENRDGDDFVSIILSPQQGQELATLLAGRP